MRQRDPLTPEEITKVNNTLIELCVELDMTFAVCFMQGGAGPLEMFHVCNDPRYQEVCVELKNRAKAFAEERKASFDAEMKRVAEGN